MLVATGGLALSRRASLHSSSLSPHTNIPEEQCQTEAALNAGFPSCRMPNFKCKNATSDWPQCKPPLEGMNLRFGSGGDLPIGAWWPPPTDGKPEDKDELTAYASANFSMVMIGDRDPAGCEDPHHHKALWDMVLRQLDVVEELGLQALIDGYVCSSWGGPANLGTAQSFFGGEEDGPPGAWVDHAYLHKPSPTEAKWIVRQLRNRTSVVGVLLADDAQDLEGSELASMQTIREHAPEIFPWVNQIMDPSDTAWLARGGYPYVMPELYSMDGFGSAGTQATSLLKDLETWGRMGERFQQKLWPLLNLPESGISDAKVRFQAYSALAYGAKGLFWFCWRSGGGWDHKSDKPGKTPIYGTLKSVNTLARAWGPSILAHPRFEGAYHAGNSEWDGPETSTHAPDEDGIVTGLSENLFVSVLTGETADDTILLFVVDKEINDEDRPRAASVTLNSALVGSVRVIGADDSSGKAHASWGTHGKWRGIEESDATLEGQLSSGGAALLEIKAATPKQSRALHDVAVSMRRWRHPSKSPNLARLRIKHHEKYSQNFADPVGPQLSTMLAAVHSTSSVRDLALAGFNALVDDATSEAIFRGRLNDGLREGMVTFASLDPSVADVGAAAESVVANHACHPYFGGVHLLSQAAAAPTAPARLRRATTLSAKHVGHATNAAATIRQTGPGEFFAMAAAPTLADRRVLHDADVPKVLLSLEQPFSQAKLDELSRAWQNSSDWDDPDDPDGNQFHVQVEGCEAAAADVQASSRFAAFAAVAFGARGVAHVGVGAPGCTELHVARSIYADAIKQWIAKGHLRKPTQIFASTSFDVRHTQRANRTEGQIVQSMDENLLISVLQDKQSSSSKWHSRREGVKLVPKPPPPMLLIVDARERGPRRTTSIELDAQVYSHAPLLGDRSAGFEDCKQADLGSTVRLSLQPGEGVLLFLNMYATEAKYNTPEAEAEAILMARKSSVSTLYASLRQGSGYSRAARKARHK